MLFLIATGTHGSSGELFTVLLNSRGQIYVWSYDADVLFASCPNLIDGQWHTVTVTYNGNGLLSLYLDGSFVQSYNIFNADGSGPISYYTTGDDGNWLGVANGQYNAYFGDLQNIAFYNHALTEAELH